jgi:hypothetical protein
MLNIIKVLITQYAAARYIFGTAGSLALALPLAALLKGIGLPLLIILGIVALPVLIILLIVGLPVFAVLLCGALLLGLIAAVMVAGLVALKVAIFVVLPIVMVVWVVRRLRASGRDSASATAAP